MALGSAAATEDRFQPQSGLPQAIYLFMSSVYEFTP
jgi:hypothetical protein